jgi:hypothetical protein
VPPSYTTIEVEIERENVRIKRNKIEELENGS